MPCLINMNGWTETIIFQNSQDIHFILDCLVIPCYASKITPSGSLGTISCLDCLQVYVRSWIGLVSISSVIYYYNIDIKLLPHLIYIYIWVITESLAAGLIASLIHNYIIGKTTVENCMNTHEEGDTATVSVSTSISDSSSMHHVNV